ncbi:MAG: hypothetical protein ABI716_01385 [Candidatus Saccharibacteria bacterium]
MSVFILLAITGIFLVTMCVNKFVSFKLCALCASIFLTWVGLLLMYKIGYFNDATLLGLLMGQSITGIYYAVSRRVAPVLRIFTLPFILTLTFGAYLLIVGMSSILPPLFTLLAVWVLAYVVFAYRNDPGKKTIVDAVINCCETT